MAATIFGDARFGVVDDDTVTQLKVGDLSYDYQTDKADALSHTGSVFSFALYNDRTEVTASGVVAAKTTGLTKDLASVLVLANESADSLSLNDQNLFTSPDANAGTVLTSANLQRTNTGFETGSLTMIFHPLVATDSPSTLTD